MKRISDEKFIENDFDKSGTYDIYGVRIKDGEFYYLGEMCGDESGCAIEMGPTWGYLMDRVTLITTGNILDAVEENCTRLYAYYERNEDGSPRDEADKKFTNEYDCFLSMIKPYERNGVVDENHDIFQVTERELMDLSDALKDGDYVFVVGCED